MIGLGVAPAGDDGRAAGGLNLVIRGRGKDRRLRFSRLIQLDEGDVVGEDLAVEILVNDHLFHGKARLVRPVDRDHLVDLRFALDDQQVAGEEILLAGAAAGDAMGGRQYPARRNQRAAAMAAEAAALFGVGRQDLHLPGPFALLGRLAADDTPAIFTGEIGILLRKSR